VPTWQPEPRPDWVVAVNAGNVDPIAEAAARPLARDVLLAEARAALGLEGAGTDGFVMGGFGTDEFVEPLDVLVDALEREAELTVVGRWLTRRFLLRLLEVRAQTVAYARADPGVRDEVIDAPVFVAGAPRTGTTILHALLAQDRRVRVPEGWELLRPVPPPDPAAFPDDARVALADQELRGMASVTSRLDTIHEYSGRMHKECLSSMSFVFRSEEFTARYHVPSYVKWLADCDMTPAYEWHRLVLQVLQRRWRDVRWALKSPVHLHSLPVLRAVYPDARVVVTHRDPLAVLGSLTSLVATLRWAHSDTVDLNELGRYHADLYHRSLDRLVDLDAPGALPGAPLVHTRYDEFLRDPVRVLHQVYDGIGIALPGDVEATMRAHLDAHPQGALGGHAWSFDDLGLDPVVERARFARYQAHFDVPDEI
jgi:hypothetical protein